MSREDEPAEIDPRDLSGVFSTPGWLRDFGVTAWLLVGITLLLVSAVVILSLADTIVLPLVTATVIAAVADPLIEWLQRHGVARGLGAVALMVAIVVLAVGVVLIIIGGITSQSGDIGTHLSDATNTMEGWLEDLGVDPGAASAATDDASSATSSSVNALLSGVAGGIKALSSLVFFLALTALSLVFLLKDGPLIRSWVERSLALPLPVAHTLTQRILESLRGYFLGVTIVAVFNAVLVGIGAFVLGVPLAGTIAAVTFFAAYVPYLGAWSAGAFSVLIALGGAGEGAAIGMVVIQLLANGVLQQLIQPIAYGAALGIHPLAVLVATIAGGALFGGVGLILAAPLVAAATKITADFARARERAVPGGPSPPVAEPG